MTERRPRGLADFGGAWSLVRRIAHDAGPDATFRGRATLVPDAFGLRYVERGTLSLQGAAPMQADRTYLWRPSPSGIAVAFDDGRPFHAIDLQSETPEAVHPCGADRYAVRYDLSKWPVWTAIWHVDGPRKGYTATSRYTRLEGPDAIGHPVGDHWEGCA